MKAVVHVGCNSASNNSCVIVASTAAKVSHVPMGAKRERRVLAALSWDKKKGDRYVALTKMTQEQVNKG